MVPPERDVDRHSNDDGIDICNSQSVRISDCYIKAGDDAIVLKSMPNERGGVTRPCENVILSNMVIATRLFHPAWLGPGEPIKITSCDVHPRRTGE